MPEPIREDRPDIVRIKAGLSHITDPAKLNNQIIVDLAACVREIERLQQENKRLGLAADYVLWCMGKPERGTLVDDHNQDEGCLDVLRGARDDPAQPLTVS